MAYTAADFYSLPWDTRQLFINTYPGANAPQIWADQANANAGYNTAAPTPAPAAAPAAPAAPTKPDYTSLDDFTHTQYYQDWKQAMADAATEDARRYEQGFGLQKDQLAEQTRRDLATIENQKQQLALSKGQAYANAWAEEQRVRLAESTHRLQQGQLATEIAKTAVQYASSPDQAFMLRDFTSAIGGLRGVPGAAGAGPVPNSLATMMQQLGLGGALKTAMADPGTATPGSSLAGFGKKVFGSQKNLVAAMTPTYGSSGGVVNGVTGGVNGGGSAPAASPQHLAAQAVVAANPPSPTPGVDASDNAAINAVANLYNQGAGSWRPGLVEDLGKTGRAVLGGGLARLGADPTTVMEDYQKGRFKVGNPLAA